MRWLRWPLRPNRVWHWSSGRRYTRGANAPQIPTPTPPPTPRELIDVIGVGRTEKVDGRALTLLSLERYVEADIVTFRIARRRSGRTFASPMLRLTVDGAKETRTWMMGGGGGGEDELIWRMAWELAPTPRDRTFVIEVSQIDWTRHDRGEQRIETVESGPWRFQITLP